MAPKRHHQGPKKPSKPCEGLLFLHFGHFAERSCSRLNENAHMTPKAPQHDEQEAQERPTWVLLAPSWALLAAAWGAFF